MKGSITLTFSAKEAVALISGTVPKTVTTKIVNAFRASNVTPEGAKASVVARAPRAAKKSPSKAKKAEQQAGDQPSAH